MSEPTDLTQWCLNDVHHERKRQLVLKAEGRFAYTPSDRVSDALKLAILTEELGEVAREVLARTGMVQEVAVDGHLRKELCQVAAVALAWMESLT